jgi:hypothetical protein
VTRSFRPAALRAAASLAAALAALAAAPAHAQEPAPRDTVPRDTVRVPIPPEQQRADTLPDRPRPDSAAADTLRPAPSFPERPQAGPAGFGVGVWEFTRADLARFHGLTLLEFMERVPGILVTRTGGAGSPAGVSLLGAGGGRVRVFVDGWEMRSLNAATFDLQRVPLLDVVAMRVERGLAETRVDLSTFRLPDARAFAQVEAADGDFGKRLLRGFFARPLGSRFVVQTGIDLSETSGFRRLSPFSINTVMARLSYQLRPDAGFQLEYRTSAIDASLRPASGVEFFKESLDRTELILRGRARLLPRLWVDGAVGRSTEEPAAGDTLNLYVRSVQAYGSATAEVGVGRLVGTARVFRGREDTFAPDGSSLEARAELRPAPWIDARGEVRLLTLGGDAGTELEAAVRVEPFAGVSLFGQVGAGARPIPLLLDTLVTLSTFGSLVGRVPATLEDTVGVVRRTAPALAGIRAGAELSRGVYRLGAALVTHDLDAVVPLGYGYDRGFPAVAGGTVTALEGYASTPFLNNNLRFDGWFVHRLDAAERPYLPGYFGRAALEFHDVFRDGNLEPTLRLEVVGRDRAPVLGDTVPVGRYAVFNTFVQVRVVDVRVFFRLENIFNMRASDVPGTRIAGPVQMYGVRWFFRN